MTRQQVKRHIQVIKAFSDGYDIQYFDGGKGVWVDIDNPSFSPEIIYRVKYSGYAIPFQFETFREHMCKQNYVVCTRTGDILSIVSARGSIMGDNIVIAKRGMLTFDQLLEDYVFLDGSPCGILI